MQSYTDVLMRVYNEKSFYWRDNQRANSDCYKIPNRLIQIDMTQKINFKPSASIENLQKRAEVLAKIRDYFAGQGVMEVEVPALAAHSVTDVHLAALQVDVLGKTQYLQTSPEFYLKRLLASGSGDIYNLAKAYRADQPSPKHLPEFTMLEWYRLGFDDRQLMQDVKGLLVVVGVKEAVTEITHGTLFEQTTGLNPHIVDTQELADYCANHFGANWPNTPRSTWLDMIFSHQIEPKLQAPTLVYHFPACQCALAKLGKNEKGETIAHRFELYWKGLELANGYWELTCPKEQAERFELDNQERAKQSLPPITPDPYLLAALDTGLPECAGVALGVDRLLMGGLGESEIKGVVSFWGDNR